ncbi:MAG: tRNA (N(6)-L-threonylcarbamoyladenosine(37)-C(2))-methylthiotransferase MtaB [Saprospiraceae bacterium]|nr:tRNA (N(6)-L-threonylcarbamoyladenosine(37)-C(2))-methylthiotransferase MtaB [Saprospiraceae bacterium]
MATPKTVAFHTLGCKLNYSETSAIGRTFESKGFQEVAFRDPASVYVINTCSVTEFADKKCRQTVRRALRQNPEAFVVVMGCYAQLKPEEISNIPGVDLVLGAAEKFKVLDYVDDLSKSPGKGMVLAGEVSEARDFHDAFSFGDRTRSFLKVQDGCDYKCSFCTIPQARGNSRSDSIEKVVVNAGAIADRGCREIVLTGVNIGDFGKLPDEEKYRQGGKFIDLIKALDEVKGIERFRISSIEPNLCEDEIIEFVSQSKRFAPHFHMPLQSGSDSMLRVMRRRYKSGLYQDRVAKIKTLMPHACIGVDVIVGFPGETEKHFMETYKFLESLDVSYFHVFTYSERANTPAAEMEGVVPMAERRARNERLRVLSQQKQNAFYKSHLGETRKVLFEKSKDPAYITGFTDNYIKVKLPDRDLINQVREFNLATLDEKGFVAGMLNDSLLPLDKSF